MFSKKRFNELMTEEGWEDSKKNAYMTELTELELFDEDLITEEEVPLSGILHSTMIDEGGEVADRVIKELVENNGVDYLYDNRRALLHVCTAEEFVDYLIQNGADVNIKDHNGRTPLLVLCAHVGTGVITTLLEEGANPYISDNNGENFYDNVFVGIEGIGGVDSEFMETIIHFLCRSHLPNWGMDHEYTDILKIKAAILANPIILSMDEEIFTQFGEIWAKGDALDNIINEIKEHLSENKQMFLQNTKNLIWRVDQFKDLELAILNAQLDSEGADRFFNIEYLKSLISERLGGRDPYAALYTSRSQARKDAEVTDAEVTDAEVTGVKLGKRREPPSIAEEPPYKRLKTSHHNTATDLHFLYMSHLPNWEMNHKDADILKIKAAILANPIILSMDEEIFTQFGKIWATGEALDNIINEIKEHLSENKQVFLHGLSALMDGDSLGDLALVILNAQLDSEGADRFFNIKYLKGLISERLGDRAPYTILHTELFNARKSAEVAGIKWDKRQEQPSRNIGEVNPFESSAAPTAFAFNTEPHIEQLVPPAQPGQNNPQNMGKSL
jgi:hypothetical protein